MVRILFIQPELHGVGGIQKVVPTVAEALVNNGYQAGALSFYGPKDKGEFWSYSESLAERPTRSVLDRAIKQVQRFRRITAAVHSFRPDCIIVSAHATAVLVLLWSVFSLSRVPVVVYVHQSLRVLDGQYGLVLRLLLRFARGFIYVSQGLAREAKELKVFGSVPYVVAYNSVSVPKSLEVKSEDPVFITASRLEYVKGVDVLIPLMVRYLSYNPGRLIVCGEGSLRGELEDMVVAAGLSQRINFRGQVEDVESVLTKAHVYVSCARAEALGLSLLEALASGLVLVLTDVPYGPREILSVDSENLTYPYRAEWGVLFAGEPPTEHHVTDTSWVDEHYEDFAMSIKLALDTRVFPREQLQDRARYFSTNRQVTEIIDLINRIQRQHG